MKTKPSSIVARSLVAVLALMVTSVALSQTGVPVWTNRYNGPGNSDDHANAIAVDGSGNVFVTGSSVGVGGSGGSYDYATLMYSVGGVPLWTNRYNGPRNEDDHALGIAVDGSGNVVVTGYSRGALGSYDYATIKYSEAGVPLWTNRYDGPANDWDYARAVAVDGSGNVFVTGASVGVGSYIDYATVAYSSAGVPLWTNRYNGPGNDADNAIALAVDRGGNVFVTGSSVGSAGDYDYATIKYSGAGGVLWTNRYSGKGHDYAYGMAVDGDGNVFVTGSSADGYVTVAYSSAGMPLWTNNYSGPGNSDVAAAVAVDSSRNVFVTGSSSSGTSIDYATVKYSGTGQPLWTNRYNGLGNGDDHALAIAVDASGNVFVTGDSFGGGGSHDCTTIIYSAAGVPLWTNSYDGPANGDDGTSCLALGPDGSAYVTGISDGGLTITYRDYVTIKYSGTVLAPMALHYQVVGNQLVLSWTNAAFSLQSAPLITGNFTNLSGAISPFTNPISGPQQYFRLKAN